MKTISDVGGIGTCREFQLNTSLSEYRRTIHAVRGMATTELARYSQLDPAQCNEVFLVHDDFFCGLRFQLGAFRAVWRIGQREVAIFRDDQPLTVVPIDSSAVTRAA